MRILITGFVIFVIWAFFSTWLYVDILKPKLKKPVAIQAVPGTPKEATDSLAKIYALMPENLIVNFEFDEVAFKSDIQLENSLAEFKSWLDKYPGSTILVTGHTDLVGSGEYNRELGLKRALSVQRYLETKGFPAERIITDSKGEDQPVAGYITPEGRAKNRRAEISINK